MPKALIFDFDGLILDTEFPIYEAWLANYRAHGQELRLEDYAGCVGSGFHGFDPKAHLEGLVGAPVDWEHWDPIREAEAHARTDLLEPFPGIVELLAEAQSRDILCVVATSSPRSWVERHLNRLDLMSFFKATRCADDVESIKPAPDLFLAAAEVANAAPADAVVLEDSLNGLRAATAAGIDCLVVPNRITAHLDFAGALGVIETLEGISLDQLVEMEAAAAPPEDQSAPSK